MAQTLINKTQINQAAFLHPRLNHIVVLIIIKINVHSLSPNRFLLSESEVTIGSGLVDGDGAALQRDIQIFNPHSLYLYLADIMTDTGFQVVFT